MKRRPLATLWNDQLGPVTLASAQAAAQRYAEVISTLEAARSLEPRRRLDVQLLRAQAYLQSGQFALASVEFHNIIAHSYYEPLSPSIPLAWLGLSKSLAAEHRDTPKRPKPRAMCKRKWQHADPSIVQMAR